MLTFKMKVNMRIKKMFYICIICICMFSCKETKTDKLTLEQPEKILLDTTMQYFTFVKKYIEDVNTTNNDIRYFILLICNNDEWELHLKIAAIDSNYLNLNFQYH